MYAQKKDCTRTQWEDSHVRPRRGASGEIKPANTSVSDFWLPELWQRKYPLSVNNIITQSVTLCYGSAGKLIQSSRRRWEGKEKHEARWHWHKNKARPCRFVNGAKGWFLFQSEWEAIGEFKAGRQHNQIYFFTKINLVVPWEMTWGEAEVRVKEQWAFEVVQRKDEGCCGLNVVCPAFPNSYVKILIPKGKYLETSLWRRARSLKEEPT